MPFHSIVPITSVGSTVLTATPTNLSARAGSEADAWGHFKMTKLAFRILPQSGVSAANTYDLILGYVGGVQDTQPATVANIGELLPSVYSPSTQTIPSNWVHVPRVDLAGPLPWYKSIAGTADATEEAPGSLCIYATQAAGTNGTRYIELVGEFVFKTSVATANTPAAVMARKAVHDWRLKKVDDDERDRIIRLLSPVLQQAGLTPPAATQKSPEARQFGF